jgi:mannose-6-phosphate isomerase
MTNTLARPSSGIDLTQPLFFKRNRVFRVYRGGKLFSEFFGDDPVDGNFPEEWIASTVKALNKDSQNEQEGLSVIRDSQKTFLSLLHEHSDAMTNDQEFDVLVKLLDSAIRLPAQAHPDRTFSRAHFQSDHGKTEMWVVLATRPGANLYFGFKDGVTRDILKRTITQSETDKNAFLEILQECPAKAGDIWLVPARVAHAIGAGCLILEVQEPTDFTIQPEHWCDQYRLSEKEMYLGLNPETALECFDFSITGEKAFAFGRKTPSLLEQNCSHMKESLISYRDTPCFAVNRHTITKGNGTIAGSAVFVVTSGTGTLIGCGAPHSVSKGDYFFLPYAAREVRVHSDQSIQLIECLPSQK